MKRLLATLVTTVMALQLGGCGLVDGGARTVTVMFADTAGLFVGNDVGVLGVRVGKVAEIEPDGEAVRVTLRIDDGELRIPARANAAVVARSVATDRYVELTPVYSGGPQLRDGATIPVDRTVTPVDFDQVLASVDKLGRGLVDNPRATQSLEDLIRISARNLDGRGEQLNRTLTSLSGAVQAVQGQSGNAVSTMRSLDTLTGALVRDEAVVREFIGQARNATQLLADERQELGRALRTLSAAVDDVAAFVKANRSKITRDVRSATAVVKSLNRARSDLAEVAQTLPLATDNLARARNPQNDNIRVRGQLTQALPISDQVFNAICAPLGTFCDGLTLPPDADKLIEALLGLRP